MLGHCQGVVHADSYAPYYACSHARTRTHAHVSWLVVAHILRYERTPLTPSTFPDFDKLVSAARTALAAHYATLDPNARDEMETLPDPLLQPCCHGIWPEGCECDDYAPHKVYP